MDTLCISGSIKALEKTFLTIDDITKISNAKTLSEAVTILDGTIYHLPQNIKGLEDITNFFDGFTIGMIKEMKKSLPKELYFYFLLPYEFHNLKLIIENYRTGRESKNYLSYSYVDYFTFKEAFEKNNLKDIPGHLKGLVGFISKNRDSENLMVLIKKLYWQVAKNLSETQHSSFIDDYIKTEIDISNLGVFLNFYVAGLTFDIKFLAEGGRIKKEKFVKEEKLWDAVRIIYPGLTTPITIEGYDRDMYALKMKYLRNGRIIPSGIDTIFSYFAARQIEIDNLRRILIGKFYNVENNRIANWILPVYQYSS